MFEAQPNADTGNLKQGKTMRTRAPPEHEKRKSMAIANQMYEQEDSVRDSIMYEDSYSKIDVTGIVDVTGIIDVTKDN